MDRLDSNIYPVWKPVDITSSDVVKYVKKNYKLDKAGHCGTLDPFAEGVLLVLSNEKTSDVLNYMNDIKVYKTTIILGLQTDTLDPTGKIFKKKNIEFDSISNDDIESVLGKFVGNIEQRPPCFSAKRINGVRLYKLARQDVFVHLKPVNVQIENISFISYENRELTIEVTCHKGVYIRQLGVDIANALGTVGYLKSLVRKSLGEFNESNSIKFNGLLN